MTGKTTIFHQFSFLHELTNFLIFRICPKWNLSLSSEGHCDRQDEALGHLATKTHSTSIILRDLGIF